MPTRTSPTMSANAAAVERREDLIVATGRRNVLCRESECVRVFGALLCPGVAAFDPLVLAEVVGSRGACTRRQGGARTRQLRTLVST